MTTKKQLEEKKTRFERMNDLARIFYERSGKEVEEYKKAKGEGAQKYRNRDFYKKPTDSKFLIDVVRSQSWVGFLEGADWAHEYLKKETATLEKRLYEALKVAQESKADLEIAVGALTYYSCVGKYKEVLQSEETHDLMSLVPVDFFKIARKALKRIERDGR